MLLEEDSLKYGPRLALIHGVGAHNGGAELMLLAASRWCIANGYVPLVDFREISRRQRAKWHLGAYVDVPRLRGLSSLGVSLIPRSLAARLRLGSRRHVSLVLDASGYYLGDEWDAHWIETVAAMYERWARSGTDIVILPQAFGPFRKARMAKAARRLLRAARMVHARDQQSFKHVTDLLDGEGNVRMAPDFTLSVTSPPQSASVGETIAIVPNVNILRRPNVTEHSYVAALAEMCELIRERNFNPVIIVHSSKGDPRLAAGVTELIPGVPVWHPEDGFEAKIAIASCVGLIGARFHALASALSSGVPVVAHSWSHKYAELLADFDWDEHLADPLDASGTVEMIVASVSDPSNSARISRAGAKLKADSVSMWTAIEDELRTPRGTNESPGSWGAP